MALSESTVRILRIVLWVVIGIEFFCTLLVLGGAGSLPAQMRNNVHADRAPNKLIFNILAVIFTFLVSLAVIILNAFPVKFWINFKTKFGLLPAFIGNCIGSIFWLAATGSAFYTAADVCQMYSYVPDVPVPFAGTCYNCYDATEYSCAYWEGNLDFTTAVTAAYRIMQGGDVLGMLMFFAATAIIGVLYFMQPKKLGQDQAERGQIQHNKAPVVVGETYLGTHPDPAFHHPQPQHQWDAAY